MAHVEGYTATSTALESNRISGEAARKRLLAGLPITERRLDLAGISTALLEGGAGSPIVLLHGPGEHAAKWLRILPELVRTHHVIAPDLPGHGTSGTIEGPIRPDRIFAWLGELIERACPTPPVLVGQILGAAIAARFAAEHGSRLRCLVLSDALGLAPFQPAPEFGAVLTAFIAEPSPENHDRLWQRCAFDLDALRDRMGESWERLRAYNLDRARAPELKSTQQSLMEQFGFPAIPSEELARITIPTFMVWGRHDLATPLPIAEAASARYGWPLHVIDGAADDPPIEQPVAFMEVLRTALIRVEAAASEALPDTREAWDRIAPGYDRTNTETQMWLGNESLIRAGLRPGMRFLDIASGSGALSIPAARMGAEVVAVDQSPIMLRLLRERAGRENMQIDTRVMDGHALIFDDDSFDMAGSQFGVMLFPDMPRGIREMARVVRPGGRVLVIAYGDPHRIDFLAFLIGAVQSVRPEFNGPPMDPPPLPFQLSDPERLVRELKTAGLKHVNVETITESTAFRSGAELWDWIAWSNPIVEEVLGSIALGDGERGVIRQTLDRLVRERAGGDGSAILSNPVNIGIGTK
ncbi:alpha/beta fold hydrolase [Sinorhizobium alkalisoli]|uniref:alpha/beta fold hydrolase n=1 Tax=Sinorhizobium alkalisoli TaxID=1752398 RepID=UPI001A97C363|nr:alpha/beta fold hydrolase [Sinorhizobium alkalisoli]MCG5481143.1 alpha/beta fold hydrolase [Sinorhizobium alkalisoli]